VLVENMQAVVALPVIADRLTDSDSDVRSFALTAMTAITHADACTLPPTSRTNDMTELKVRQCFAWWNESGKQLFPGNKQ
jgi:hypothetical protein